MTLEIRVAPRAAEQIREVSDWWLDNRPKAPLALEEDLERGFALISSLPGAGQRVRHTRISGLRRVLLGRVHYYLYYTLDSDQGSVEVLALWHARRDGYPPLD